MSTFALDKKMREAILVDIVFMQLVAIEFQFKGALSQVLKKYCAHTDFIEYFSERSGLSRTRTGLRKQSRVPSTNNAFETTN